MDVYDKNSPFEVLVDASPTHTILVLSVDMNMDIDLAFHNAPFELGLIFNGYDGLYIKYTKELVLRSFKEMLPIGRDRMNKKAPEPFSWEEEKLMEPEVMEKDYFLQLINNRLTHYIKSADKFRR